MAEAHAFVLDPMLATGGSAVAALDSVKKAGAEWIRMVSVVSAPEGIEALEKAHPDVPVVTAAIDRELSDQAYILPGLGDFGDRLFGTVPSED
jgi:uracil phosphoribosyltransferase